MLTIFWSAVLFLTCLLFLVGIIRFFTGKNKSGWYVLLSVCLFYGSLLGFLAFEQGEKEPILWVIFPFAILGGLGATRKINNNSFLPKIILSSNGKKVVNGIYRQIFVSFSVFLLSTIACLYLFNIAPEPTLKIGGTFSLVSIVVEVISGKNG